MITIQNVTFNTRQDLLDELRHYLTKHSAKAYNTNVCELSHVPFFTHFLISSNVDLTRVVKLEIKTFYHNGSKTIHTSLIDSNGKRHKISWIKLAKGLPNDRT